jgi:alpha-beta hydrolase superfamily lysophospholipase
VEAVYGNPARVSNAEVDRFFEMSLREGNRRALHQRIQTLLAEVPTGLHAKAWPLVKAPTLLLWGEKDRLIPPVNARVFADAISGSQVAVLPGLGHVPHEEDPAASVAPVLVEYVPAKQSMHDALPVLVLYFPATHALHKPSWLKVIRGRVDLVRHREHHFNSANFLPHNLVSF